MAGRDVKEFFSSCPSPEACFAGDAEAYLAYAQNEDLRNLAHIAMMSGALNLPSADAVRIKPSFGEANVTPILGAVEEKRVAIPDMGDTQTGSEQDEPTVDDIRRRVANCALTCGRSGFRCPVFPLLGWDPGAVPTK